MPVRAIGEYDFPSRSRQELYGDDQLVSVLWDENLFMVAAGCFRAPKAMGWGDFVTQMVEPWAATDPDFVPGSEKEWTLDGSPITPDPGKSLAEHGVGHKSVLAFRT